MTEHFLPFKSGATTTSSKLLAINLASVSAIYSPWQEDLGQHVLVLHLNSNRLIKVYEEDVVAVLKDLGLSEYTDSWVLDLAEDLA